MTLRSENSKRQEAVSEGQVLERYLPLVRRRANAFRSMGVEPDDLVQEGLIGLLYAARAYQKDHGASFETFAYRCITNRLRTAVIAAGRTPLALRYDGSLKPGGGELCSTLQQDPEEIFIDREETQRWLDRMSSLLSGFEKQAIWLYLRGYSYQEMAASLQSTTKAVDNALQRARRKLRAV
jgi:RNA polymerase sporulation-specific sigma factor